jgi:8-oxo-dGTP pyrophosphatase MutT (NUDIX family)
MSLKRQAVEVAVFVHRGGQLLVCHRTREDYWHIVAGALERGETLSQAAKRELWEETALDAQPQDLGLEQSYALNDAVRELYAEGTQEVLVGNFHVAAPAGWEPTLNEEHDRYDWADLDVAGELMYWTETREAIAALAERLRTQP